MKNNKMKSQNRPSPDRRPSPSRRSRSRNSHIPHQLDQSSPGMPYMNGNGVPYHPGPHPGGPVPYGPPIYPHHPMGRHHHDDTTDEAEEPTPICRCRVLYLGSAVPHVTKDGLQGIQEPLKELYPEEGALGAKGIDSWLSVWSNGFLLENVDENRKKVTRFFPVESLHYCAAVRYVLVPGTSASTGEKVQRFLPLDSPFARNPNANHPPLFAAILRRTTGIKVLECHVFICKRETAANALVRCSFHSYADSTYAKHLESGGQSIYGTIGAPTPIPSSTPTPNGGQWMMSNGNGSVHGMMMRPETPGREYQQSVIEVGDDSIDSINKVEEWKMLANGTGNQSQTSPTANMSGIQGRHSQMPNGTSSPRENGNGSSPDDMSNLIGDDNHKVWAGKTPEPQEGAYDYGSTLRSFRSNASGLSHRNRPRQLTMPSSPPPPPIPEESNSKEEKKEKKKKKRSKSRDKSRDMTDSGADFMHSTMLPNGEVPRSSSSMINGGMVMTGGHPRSRKQSTGSLMNGRVNGHGPPRGGKGSMPPGPIPPPMMMMPMEGGKKGKKSGTFSARGQKGAPPHPIPPFMMYGGPPPGPPPMGPYGMPPPPHLMPPPGHPMYGMPPQGMPPLMHPPPPNMRPGSRAMEEPIYMPHNARPLSPVASYQPGHFPHEAYYNQQQYATIDKANRYRKNKRSTGGSSSKGSRSKQQSSDSNAEDSEFGAGIHGKKGHINERAFSYSIRNEQRSRSYGSLVDIEIGPNGEPIQNNNTEGQNGGPGEMGDGPRSKKEQELMQMMTDLDLGDDTIERSEVPPGLYRPNGHPPNMYGPSMGTPPSYSTVMAPDPMLVNGPSRKKR